MVFLSELMNKPVTDIDGKVIGKLHDLVAGFHGDLAHPVIEAIVVDQKDDRRMIPYGDTAVLISPAIPLNCREEEVHTYQPAEADIYLAKDILDKQIIDTEGARVVRVNDVELLRVNNLMVVSNVDVGGAGILRRLGLGKAAKGLTARAGNKRLLQNSISWDDVELLRGDQKVRLKVPGEKIAELHPADIAEIISDLNRLESRHLLDSLDVEHLADALEEVEPEFQASLLEGMDDEKVADVLEEMEPDEAADLLAELPKERSADLLALMEKDEAADVRKLLTYPVDSAGGIMTTEYAWVKPEMTAGQAIAWLRETATEAETIFYVYVVDPQDHLLGVFSLSTLIFADPDQPVKDFMKTRVISVSIQDDQSDVAQVISKYDLIAVPVVDENDRLHGIVTADDALDKIIPTAWKKRLPRFYR